MQRTIHVIANPAAGQGTFDVRELNRQCLQAEVEAGVRHWQARSIRVEAAPNADVQVDGEMIGKTPVEVGVLPGAVRVIVTEGDNG